MKKGKEKNAGQVEYYVYKENFGNYIFIQPNKNLQIG